MRRENFHLEKTVSFFKNVESSFIFPFLLTFLNAPSVVYETFPFIFFIATQFFFIKLLDKEELDIFKKISLSNFKIISLLSFFSLILSIFIIIIFYNLSSNLKFMYLEKTTIQKIINIWQLSRKMDYGLKMKLITK